MTSLQISKNLKISKNVSNYNDILNIESKFKLIYKKFLEEMRIFQK